MQIAHVHVLFDNQYLSNTVQYGAEIMSIFFYFKILTIDLKLGVLKPLNMNYCTDGPFIAIFTESAMTAMKNTILNLCFCKGMSSQ